VDGDLTVEQSPEEGGEGFGDTPGGRIGYDLEAVWR
jgi:hypothetical protein